MTTCWGTAAIAAVFLSLAAAVSPCVFAEPIVPTRDDEVIEVLPASPSRADDRRTRQVLAARPGDPVVAVRAARADLQRAREQGDPRYAGLALATLRPWPDAATAPPDVVLLRATLQQYLHEFEPSIAILRQLLTRQDVARPVQAQALLTLATVLRVRGRWPESDEACGRVVAVGATLHGQACLAENAGLRGETAKARAAFETLLAGPGVGADTQGWLLTSLAELEERDGRAAQAEKAYRTALRLAPDLYTAVAYADFLIDHRRATEALTLLRAEPRTDAVVLRLAIASMLAPSANAAHDVADMRERITAANARPEARVLHGREQSMFALRVEGRAAEALELARGNAAEQREPIDVLALAAAAKATGDAAAIEEARRLKRSLGLHDRRIDALL